MGPRGGFGNVAFIAPKKTRSDVGYDILSDTPLTFGADGVKPTGEFPKRDSLGFEVIAAWDNSNRSRAEILIFEPAVEEALRFQDRLVAGEEKLWTDDNIDVAASQSTETKPSRARPCFLTSGPPGAISLLIERLRVFYEEELDVPLVLPNDVLDHVLRIDRMFRQTGEDFDEDLGTVLHRAGTEGEKICFIVDESNVLDFRFPGANEHPPRQR